MGTVINLSDKEVRRTPDETLASANGEYKDLVIIGWDNDGDLSIHSNTGMLRKDVLWLIEQVKITVLDNG